MSTFVMLTQLNGSEVKSAKSYEKLEKDVVEAIQNDCPDVKWLTNLATMGPYDYVDIFEAPDIDEAMKVGAIVRSKGNAKVEIWGAESWKRFKELMREIPA